MAAQVQPFFPGCPTYVLSQVISSPMLLYRLRCLWPTVEVLPNDDRWGGGAKWANLRPSTGRRREGWETRREG